MQNNNINENDIFDKYIDNKIEKPQNNEVQIKNETPPTIPATKKSLAERFLSQVVAYAETSGEVLNQKTKTLAVDIITQTNKALVGQQISWNTVDISGCGLISQIKRWAKLGVSMEDKLYPDIRRNSKTGLFDIVIKGQYQTIEKLIVKYFQLPVLRFKEDIICVGDEIIEEEDFMTGLSKITGHKRNVNIDRNKMENIIGAYKIMYIKDIDGTINQYVIKIDKNRIDRAFKASPSKEKTVWHLDTRKMILKTCTWEMWNDKNIRAFMKFPEDIVTDLSILDDTNEMDWDAETKFKNVNQAQENAQVNVATGEIVNMTYDEE